MANDERKASSEFYSDSIERFIYATLDEITKRANNDESCTLHIDKDVCKLLADDWEKIKWLEIY